MTKGVMQAGFSLVLVLAAFAVSANTKQEKYVNISKNVTSCEEKLKDCYNALLKYSDGKKGQLPEKNNYAGLKELRAHGVTNEDFRCSHYKGEKYDFDADRKAEEKRLKQLDKDKKKNKGADAKKRTPYKPRVAFSERHSGYVYFGGINLTKARSQVPKMIVMCDKITKPVGKGDHLMVLTADNKVEEIKLDKESKIKIASTADLVDYLNVKYKYPNDIYRALRARAVNIDAELMRAAAAGKK